MPNRAIYENSFKSTIWYSKKLKDAKKIKEEFIKLAGFTDEDVERIDRELVATKKKNEELKVEEDSIIIKKIEVDMPVESKIEEQYEPEKKIEVLEQETEEEQILNSVITRLQEM
jgi:CRISPR/Cas system type I-B associated protein Csh2 (Cas7 group RAMP superfamily)